MEKTGSLVSGERSLNIPRFDPLMAFAMWYLAQPFVVPPVPEAGVRRVGKFTGLTLYRGGQFQVELWIADPNSEIPDHSHPNVDTIQVYLNGQIYLRVNGEERIKPEDVYETADGLSSKYQFMTRIGPNDVHGATVGPKGGSFLNFQEWKSGSPTSVVNDWDGVPLSKEHADQIGVGYVDAQAMETHRKCQSAADTILAKAPSLYPVLNEMP